MRSAPQPRDSGPARRFEPSALHCSSPIPTPSTRAPLRRRRLNVVASASPRAHLANSRRILRPPFQSVARHFLESVEAVMAMGATRAAVCRAGRHQVQDCLISYQVGFADAPASFITLSPGTFVCRASKPDFPFVHDQILRWGRETPHSARKVLQLIYPAVKDWVLADPRPNQWQHPD